MPSASLAVEWIPIERVFLSPSNPRINDPAVEHVAASIRKFDWQQPIVAKRSGEVIAGNTRLKAAKSLGLTSVPVVWFEGTDLQATAYQVADNRVAEFSSFDEPALAKILEFLRAELRAMDVPSLVARYEAVFGRAPRVRGFPQCWPGSIERMASWSTASCWKAGQRPVNGRDGTASDLEY